MNLFNKLNNANKLFNKVKEGATLFKKLIKPSQPNSMTNAPKERVMYNNLEKNH